MCLILCNSVQVGVGPSARKKIPAQCQTLEDCADVPRTQRCSRPPRRCSRSRPLLDEGCRINTTSSDSASLASSLVTPPPSVRQSTAQPPPRTWPHYGSPHPSLWETPAAEPPVRSLSPDSVYETQVFEKT